MRTLSRKADFPNVDYSDIAFQIATSEQLDTLLPVILSQNALQSACLSQLENYHSLFVLTPGHKYQVACRKQTTAEPPTAELFRITGCAGTRNQPCTKNPDIGRLSVYFLSATKQREQSNGLSGSGVPRPNSAR